MKYTMIFIHKKSSFMLKIFNKSSLNVNEINLQFIFLKIVYLKLIISALYEFWKHEYFISYFYDI